MASGSSVRPEVLDFLLRERAMPTGPWRYTDDTVMALSIVEVLERHGEIESNRLSDLFAKKYAEDPDRGYGSNAHRILRAVGNGEDWRDVAPSAFGGAGSMGNGGAMRVAPLGAYFADDIERAAFEARRSAEVTHAHLEGQAGAIAVAVAAAAAINGEDLLDAALRLTPASETKHGIERAAGAVSGFERRGCSGRSRKWLAGRCSGHGAVFALVRRTPSGRLRRSDVDDGERARRSRHDVRDRRRYRGRCRWRGCAARVLARAAGAAYDLCRPWLAVVILFVER